jgi:hypothetical protein
LKNCYLLLSIALTALSALAIDPSMGSLSVLADESFVYTPNVSGLGGEAGAAVAAQPEGFENPEQNAEEMLLSGSQEGLTDDFRTSEFYQDAMPTDLPKVDLSDVNGNEFEALLADGEERFGEGVTPIADVYFGNSRFIFVQISGTDGEPAEVATIEQTSPNTPDPSEDARLSDATPLDLFLAITSEEMEIPDELLVYEEQGLGERGWFLEEVQHADRIVPRANCNNSDFRASLRNWRPEINDGEIWRLNTGVGDGGNWTGPVCGTALSCNNPTFFSLFNNLDDYSLFNVDEMKQRVAICSMNPSRRVCANSGGCISHLGPTVRFEFRRQNNASTGQVFSRDMTAADLNTVWRWRWHGSPIAGQHNWDWRIRINHVKQGDQFDLGWIFEHRGW